ncbi:MAG: hypothetical protein AAF589_02835 [Planctomycetota bacterium]
MKSSDLLSNLPSVSELLSHPQLQSVVDRLNHSAATARVRGFLDELRQELAKRADDLPLPSLREVIDRVTRYVASDSQGRLRGAINATGRFRGGPWVSTPLADAAIERSLRLAKDFAIDGLSPTPDASDATEVITRLTGAEAAAVLHTRAGALSLVLTELAARPPLVVARGDLGEVDPGCRFTDLCNTAGARMCEVGSTDSVTLEDYTAALPEAGHDEDGGVVVRLARDNATASPATPRPTTAELAAAVHARGGLLVEDVGSAPLVDLPDAGGEASAPCIEGVMSPSAAATLGAGADLVLVRGDGVIGGPGLCLVAGAADLIESVLRHPLAAAHQPTAAALVALSATLEEWSDLSKAMLRVPTPSLLSTPLENLRTRAERLAPQLVESLLVAAAEAMPLPAESGAVVGLPVRQASFAVSVTPAEGSASELQSRLAGGTPGLHGRVDGDRLLLDLRTVFPRQDLALLSAFSPDSDGGEGANQGEGG